MPLNKEYCKKCWKKAAVGYKGKYGWIFADKILWDAVEIECPSDYEESIDRKITTEPPPKCPFILEHILNNED